MRLKPVNDKIVVKESEKNKEEKTESGIILPDTVKDAGLVEIINRNTYSGQRGEWEVKSWKKV